MSDTSENYSSQEDSPSQGNSQSQRYSQSQEDTSNSSQGNSPTQDNSNTSQGNSPSQDNSNSSQGNSASQDTSNSSQGNSPSQDNSNSSQGNSTSQDNSNSSQGNSPSEDTSNSSQDTSNTDDNNNNNTPSDSSDSPPAPSANTDDNNNTPSNSSAPESSPESQSQNTPNNNSPPAPKSGGHDGSSNAPPANDNSHNNGGRSQSPPSNKISGQSSDKSSSDNSKEDDFGRKVTIGLLVGGVLLLLVFCLFITRCIRNKRKKKKQQNDIPYYEYASAEEKGGQMYYMGQPQGHWQPPPDHVVKLNSQAVGMSPHAAGMSPHAAGMSPQTAGMSPGSPWGLPAHLLPGAVVGESTGFSSGPRLPPLPPPSPNVALGMNKSSFTYEDLSAATNGFSDANILGQGGFGYVHKGILPNGKEVAVKSLKAGSGQGEREFQAEVDIISRVHHRHLVSLYGYCIAGGQMMLVYEFVPNMTMEHHLHGKNLPVMDFQTRLRIALGSAKGLAYLHEDCHPKIIHRDIKASNILLENNFEARVSDFGLAKLSADNFTHVSTRVMGTFGYLAPEYASSGKLTDKSDVFSYGVVLLELITGKQPVDNTGTMDDSLVDWARPLLAQSMEEGNFDQLVDPRLQQNYNPYEMKRMMAAAAASIRHSAKKRPKMSQIVRALEGDSSLDDLNDGVKPGHSSIFSSSGGSSDLSRGSYNAELKKLQADSSSSGEFVASSRDGTPTHKANMP